jgi:signal peptidase I
MAPTIKPGERVTINLLAYTLAQPRRWDVVALEAPPLTNMVVLKRIMGLPGETVSLTRSGLVVNGSLVPMPDVLTNAKDFPVERLPGEQRIARVPFPYTVPTGHYFVIGDNWTNSYDSRHYGAVPRTNILGRVWNK